MGRTTGAPRRGQSLGPVLCSDFPREGAAFSERRELHGWITPTGSFISSLKHYEHIEALNEHLSGKWTGVAKRDALADGYCRVVHHYGELLVECLPEKRAMAEAFIRRELKSPETKIKFEFVSKQGHPIGQKEVALAATKYAPSDHVYDVWWYTGSPDVDQLMIRALYSLGIAAKLSTSTPMRVGYRLFSRRNESEVRKRLGLKLKSGRPSQRAGTARGRKDEVHDLDVSIREVTQDVGTREASSASP